VHFLVKPIGCGAQSIDHPHLFLTAIDIDHGIH
jgi:hypothetical protein